jgi:hypothetical protein
MALSHPLSLTRAPPLPICALLPTTEAAPDSSCFPLFQQTIGLVRKKGDQVGAWPFRVLTACGLFLSPGESSTTAITEEDFVFKL